MEVKKCSRCKKEYAEIKWRLKKYGKRCSSCGQTKGASEFYKKTDSPDGLQGWCKQCVRGYQPKKYEKNKKPKITVDDIRNKYKNTKTIRFYDADARNWRNVSIIEQFGDYMLVQNGNHRTCIAYRDILIGDARVRRAK